MARHSGQFQPGAAKPEGSGRQSGTPNKRDVQMLECLERLKCNPFEFHALVVMEKLTDKDGNLVPVTLDQRIQCANNLMPFLLPKQKALEVSGSLTVIATPAEEAAKLSMTDLVASVDHTQEAIEQPNA